MLGYAFGPFPLTASLLSAGKQKHPLTVHLCGTVPGRHFPTHAPVKSRSAGPNGSRFHYFAAPRLPHLAVHQQHPAAVPDHHVARKKGQPQDGVACGRTGRGQLRGADRAAPFHTAASQTNGQQHDGIGAGGAMAHQHQCSLTPPTLPPHHQLLPGPMTHPAAGWIWWRGTAPRRWPPGAGGATPRRRRRSTWAALAGGKGRWGHSKIAVRS